MDGREWQGGDAMSEWISTAERLPKETKEFGLSKPVLFVAPDGVKAGYYKPHWKMWFTLDSTYDSGRYAVGDVVSWQPWPEPPKEEGQP